MTIHPRYCGPDGTGNGGYVAGLLAKPISGAVEVTLHRPPPLGKGLSITTLTDGGLRLDHDGAVIAEARPTEWPDFHPITPPHLDEARAASGRYIGHHNHAYPNCYVCGPNRAEGDGLRIFAGPISPDEATEQGAVVATPWRPPAYTGNDQGEVASEFLWAAIDCPGAFAAMGGTAQSLLLGRLTAQQIAPVRLGEDYVVCGWPIGRDGRKHFTATAIFDTVGTALIYGQATWIAPRPA